MKVFVIQTDATGTMASVVDPRVGSLVFAGAIIDAIEFLKSKLFESDEK